jgi:RNA polymerase sigma-70 factor (ECF subfamily)
MYSRSRPFVHGFPLAAARVAARRGDLLHCDDAALPMASPKMSASIDLPVPVGLVAEIPQDAARVQADVLELFDAYADGLRRYVRAIGLTPAAADDVVQEAFLSLFRHLRLGRPRQNLRAWLYRVAHNLALRHRRRLSRGPHGLGAHDAARDPIDPSEGPEERLAGIERRRRLRAVARALPARDRRCLYLRAEGLCYRDIAQTLGVSLGSVAKSLARAFTRLANSERG